MAARGCGSARSRQASEGASVSPRHGATAATRSSRKISTWASSFGVSRVKRGTTSGITVSEVRPCRSARMAPVVSRRDSSGAAAELRCPGWRAAADQQPGRSAFDAQDRVAGVDQQWTPVRMRWMISSLTCSRLSRSTPRRSGFSPVPRRACRPTTAQQAGATRSRPRPSRSR